MPRAREVGIALCFAAAAAYLACGSGSASVPASAAAGTGAGASAGAGAGGSSSAGASGMGKAGKAGAGGGKAGDGGAAGQGGREVKGNDCPVVPFENDVVDSSWGQWSGFDCELSALVPPSAEKVPPAPWGACPDALATLSGCQMAGSLGFTENDQWVALGNSGKVWEPTPDGGGLLGVIRAVGTPGAAVLGAMRIDGTMVSGVNGAYGGTPLKFLFGFAWIADGVSATSVIPKTKGTEHGVLAMKFGEQYPAFTHRGPDSGVMHSDWAVSKSHVFRHLIGIDRFSWDGNGPTPVYRPQDDPDSLAGYMTDTVGDTLFLKVQSGGKGGVLSWTEQDGLRPLLRWYGTYEHIATRWATDGKDMVWLEGEGPQSDIYINEKRTLMTAPYSLDMKTLEATKKPLGPDPVQDGGLPNPLAVGCGYLASTFVTPQGPKQSVGLTIVRMSDATRWHLTAKVSPYPLGGVGITCEHVYFRLPNSRVGRVPLSSLPPDGSPP